MTPSISVVIPAYNSLGEVLKCLCSLQMFASKTIPIEFIIADDSSPDVFYPALIPHCAAKVISSETNGGFGVNCNTGAHVATGDVLFFCNQDVFAGIHPLDGDAVSQNWDIALANAFEDTTIGIVGAKLLFPDSGAIQNAGGKFDGNCTPFHRGLGYSNHKYAEVNTPETVSWTTGGALAIRRTLFEQLGGFDASYRAYFEDVDLCLRAREAGFKVWYEPRCILFHAVGTSGGSVHFARSAQMFHDKWVSSKRVHPDMVAISNVRYW